MLPAFKFVAQLLVHSAGMTRPPTWTFLCRLDMHFNRAAQALQVAQLTCSAVAAAHVTPPGPSCPSSIRTSPADQISPGSGGEAFCTLEPVY